MQFLHRKPSSQSKITNVLNIGIDDDLIETQFDYGGWRTVLFTSTRAKLASVLQLLLVVRFLSAIFNIITDCDETFNYWEPIHYLIKGNGLQTWEYSPDYAIRSYAYLWLYAFPAYVLSFMPIVIYPILNFYVIRISIAIFCAFAEAYCYSGIIKKFGYDVGKLWLLFQAFSAGMFISSSAVLPSSFSMYFTLFTFGAYFHKHHRVALASIGISVLLGWPFSGILYIPILIRYLFSQKRFNLIRWGIFIGALIFIPMVLVDTHYYGKLVIAPLNIVLYNVFSKHGPNLYGTEPFSFYILNCFLNFNFIFLIALISPLIFVIGYFGVKNLKIMSDFSITVLISFWAWIIIFFFQAHKEERFMFPIYPLISLIGALTLVTGQQIIINYTPVLKRFYDKLTQLMVWIFIGLSISRIMILFIGYHAPIDVYTELSLIDEKDLIPGPVNVCVGKEWHRFPTSFFFPDSSRWKLRFLKSEFKGQLPQPFADQNMASQVRQANFNDENREEPNRYINEEQCYFIVDTDYETFTERDKPYSKMKDLWSIERSVSFLDHSSSSHSIRAFFVPFFTHKYGHFVNYNLLRNRRLHEANIKN